jgi:hypothetical protein
MSSVSSAKKPTATESDDSESDIVWGARGVGRVINRNEQQVYHLLSIGALNGAATKLGHKTIIGSRKALLNLPFKTSK